MKEKKMIFLLAMGISGYLLSILCVVIFLQNNLSAFERVCWAIIWYLTASNSKKLFDDLKKEYELSSKEEV